jgi:hypothetical protein
MHSGNTQSKLSVLKPPTNGTPQPPSVKKGTHVASRSNQPLADLQVDDKHKGADYLVEVLRMEKFFYGFEV